MINIYTDTHVYVFFWILPFFENQIKYYIYGHYKIGSNTSLFSLSLSTLRYNFKVLSSVRGDLLFVGLMSVCCL
jgi:hypothetical protein